MIFQKIVIYLAGYETLHYHKTMSLGTYILPIYRSIVLLNISKRNDHVCKISRKFNSILDRIDELIRTLKRGRSAFEV